MGLEYIQLFADMEALFEPYDDAQRGRLVMAMMAYAYRSEEPQFTGVEKFIWPVLKQHIDRCAANVEAKKAAGSKGGKRKYEESPAEADASKGKQTQAEASKGKQSEAEESESKQNAHNHDHDNDHEQEQDHKQEKKSACAREEATAAAAKKAEEPIIGIDGTDLSGAMADYDRAGELVSRYKLPDTDQSREALLMDAGAQGWEKVERALSDAAKGNSRPMLSVNFYRAVLKNQGKPRGNQGVAASGDTMMRYSAEERKATFSAAIVDFDEE